MARAAAGVTKPRLSYAAPRAVVLRHLQRRPGIRFQLSLTPGLGYGQISIPIVFNPSWILSGTRPRASRGGRQPPSPPSSRAAPADRRPAVLRSTHGVPDPALRSCVPHTAYSIPPVRVPLRRTCMSMPRQGRLEKTNRAGGEARGSSISVHLDPDPDLDLDLDLEGPRRGGRTE